MFLRPGNAYVLRSIVPLYLVISLSQFITPMLMVVVDEKEKKIKESMKMVGLRDSVFWISWFLVYAVMVLVISVAATALTAAVLIPSADPLVLFVMVFLFGLSIIMFAFMLTSLFSKAKAAGVVGGLSLVLLSALYYLQVRKKIAAFLITRIVVPHSVFQVYLEGAPAYVFWLLSLLSPTAVAMGLDKVRTFFPFSSRKMHKFPFLPLPGKSSYSAKSIASAPESIHCTHSVLHAQRDCRKQRKWGAT